MIGNKNKLYLIIPPKERISLNKFIEGGALILKIQEMNQKNIINGKIWIIPLIINILRVKNRS